jgi:hypothetical protein
MGEIGVTVHNKGAKWNSLYMWIIKKGYKRWI